MNADDPEAVMLVAKIAAEWRATWHRDVVIDLVGYRKFGHNEIDEPMFTQPIMYSIIKVILSSVNINVLSFFIQKHPNVLDIYSKKLIGEGVATQEEVQAVVDKYDRICEEAYKKASEETQVMIFLTFNYYAHITYRSSINIGWILLGLDFLRVKIL